LNNGIQARLTLWQADDARHFPVRIEAAYGATHMEVNFSDIHLEYPSQDLFRPPDGFAAYDSAMALMNELMVRDASLIKQATSGEPDEPTDIRSNNWRPTTAPGIAR
jgi:hypothetical protein